MWLTRLALKNPVLILMLSLMTIVLGVVSLRRLSVDLFPDINIPVIRVATFYTGAGPTDIEKSITEPVERAVSASPGVARVESFSKQGVSVVSVWFDYGTDLDNAQFEVSQRVAQILNVLPTGVQQPFILKFDISNIPVATVQIRADGMDEAQLYDLAYNVIEPQIERLPGIASATVGGGKQREIEVEANPEGLRARGLSLLDLLDGIRTSNLMLPSGHIKVGERDYNVFSNSRLDQVSTLERVIVRGPSQNGQVAAVRVSDLAEVNDSTAEQSEIVRVDGQRGVYLRVLKQPGANTISVVDALKALLPRLTGVPANVHAEVAFDQSTYIRSAVSSLQHEAIFGGLLAIVVILIFLASLRATGIVAVAIPLSIIGTFVLLYFTHQTLNVFTLGGLALGVGRLVDDSIVELENISRHLGKGQSRLQSVLAAAREVAMPILVSTITTIVVFLPVLFLAGVARYLFLPLALTISFALLISFFVSRTVTPLLCYYTLSSDSHEQLKSKWPAGFLLRVLDGIDGIYAVCLGWVLRHRALTVIGVAALFAASLWVGRGVGTEFFPSSDENQITLNFRTPVGTRVERSEEVAIKLEDTARQALTDPGGTSWIKTVFSLSGLPLGRSALFATNSGPHTGSVQLNLVSPSSRPLSDVQATEKIRKGIGDRFPGTNVFFFTGGIVKRILNFGAAAPIDVEVVGYDLEAGGAYSAELAAKLRALTDAKGRPMLSDVQISREDDYPELRVQVDREKAGILGVSEQQIAQTVLTGLVGNTQFAPIPFIDPKSGYEYRVNLRLDDAHRSHLSDLSELFFRAPSGGLVALDTVAKVERNSGPVQVTRKYLQRVIDVTANVAKGIDLGAAAAATEGAMANVSIPEGFQVRLSGESAAQREAFSGLAFAAAMAIVLVYMVLASQFKSLVDPLVIMFTVPLGVGGVMATLYITETTLSVNSFMGIIMMVGIVVSNGVLLVDFANLLRRRGMGRNEAVIEAGRTRLRPILMTSVATVVGLLPMALGIGEGSETNLPLARAVIGGLSVSTVLTLFLVPALYTLLDRFARRRMPTEEELQLLGAGAEVADG